MTSCHCTWRSLSSSSLSVSLLRITGLKGLGDEELDEPFLEFRSFADAGDDEEDNDDNNIDLDENVADFWILLKQAVGLVVGAVPEAIEDIFLPLERKRFGTDHMGSHRFFYEVGLVWQSTKIRNIDFSGTTQCPLVSSFTCYHTPRKVCCRV